MSADCWTRSLRVLLLLAFCVGQSVQQSDADAPLDGSGLVASNNAARSQRSDSGNASCPCIASLADFGVVPGDVVAVVGGTPFNYGPRYGDGGCALHDALRPPHCNVVLPRGNIDVAVDMPKWCFQPWCYVNASACAMSTTPSGYAYRFWREASRPDLHFSYSTCESEDLYTDILTAEQERVLALLDETAASQHLLRVVISSLGGPLALALLVYCIWQHVKRMREMRRLQAHRLRITSNHHFATAKACESGRFHLFLSHAWQSGQDQVRIIKERLVLMQPDLQIFLDVDDLDLGRGCEYVDRSQHVLAFISAGYTESPNCMRELLRAGTLGRTRRQLSTRTLLDRVCVPCAL